MTPMPASAAQWPALSRLLDDALALPPEQRPAWLAQLAGADAEHRQTLSDLLDTQAGIETGDFLQALPTFPPEAPADELTAGATVGPYRLIEPLGQGGMGVVWRAERADGTVKRAIALKLPRAVWGGAFAERLGREREILAGLEHEHIARLYDAGLDAQGRPYLAMELVDGEPIDAYCRAHALGVRARVELLLQAMAAVAHAHARLVVHRDLKPANILVDGNGRVRLLDFGVAKLLEGDVTRDTALTELSGRALTLDYASPEQISGLPLGTGSDVYSLAVVAYELLAGQRPYRLKRGTAAELEEAIASAEVPLASASADDPALCRQLRGDLDAILNKALKKRPDERYLTMDAFAQDLRRWRDGEPVQARPDGLGYRARKFVGRHRLQVAAGGVVAVALVAGASVALWQAQRAQTEAATAKAVQGFLEGVFQANSGDQADPVKARETTARELLDRGAERIDAELQQQPAARLRLLGVLASMYDSMGLVERQIAMRRQQLTESRKLSGPSSDESVIAMAQLADALTAAEQRPEAAVWLRDATAVLDARRDHDSKARFWVEVMQASLDRRGDPAHGVAATDRALAIANRYPPDAALLRTLQIRGENAVFAGEYEIARQAFAEKVRISEERAPLGASDLCETYGSLADALVALEQFDQAEASQRKGIEIARRRSEPLKLHNTESQLATLYVSTGRYREGVEAGEPASRWANSIDAAAFPEPARYIKVNHAGALLYYGRLRAALAELDRDASLTIEPAQASELDLAALGMRASTLTQLGRLAEARAVLDRSRLLLGHANGKLSPVWTDTAERRWLVASGRAVEAWAAFKASDAGLQPTPGAAPSASALTEGAWLALQAGDAAAAELQASQALAAIGAGGQAHYQRDFEARATLVLGRALLRQQRAAEALPVLDKAVAQHRAVYDPDLSPAVADAWLALAQARRALGDPRAADADKEALKIRSAPPAH